jgi:sugar/nucleoside kinase (ribokinase family)
MFLHNPGANDTFDSKDINFDLVSRAKLLHLGYPPLMRKLYENEGEELVKIFKKAKDLGTRTSLDCTLPDPESPSGKVDWRKILENTLPYVDIFLPSAEEILFMLSKEKFFQLDKEGDILGQLRGEDLSSLSGEMLNYGVKIAGIKCGYRGFYVRTASPDKFGQIGRFGRPGDLDNWSRRELWGPTYYVSKIASATGSGDSAIAGFLSAYLKGERIESALNYACTLGAQRIGPSKFGLDF